MTGIGLRVDALERLELVGIALDRDDLRVDGDRGDLEARGRRPGELTGLTGSGLRLAVREDRDRDVRRRRDRR